MQMLELYQILW